MTENEAIERLKCMRLFMEISDKQNENKFLEDDYIANKIAIQALEEIQQYRTIGTVEELIKTQIREKVLNVELESYKEIGTIEEFKALKEKNEPKEMDRFYCPICRHYFEDTDAYNYCPACGQKMKPIWQ